MKKKLDIRNYAKVIENLQVKHSNHTAYYDYLFDLLVLGRNIPRPMTKPNNDNGKDLCTDV